MYKAAAPFPRFLKKGYDTFMTATRLRNARTPDPATRRAIELFLKEIAPYYGIAGAVLFGSRARGDHRPDSDVDLAVLLRGQKSNPLPIVSHMAGAAADVMLDTGILVEAWPIWLEDWEHPEQSSNPDLLKNIRRDGIPL